MKRLQYIFYLCVVFYSYAEDSFYGTIAKENLKSLINVDDEKTISFHGKKFYEILQEHVREQIHPKEEIKRRLAFRLLVDYEKQSNQKRNSALDTRSWFDLEMVCGSAAHPHLYLANQIDRTSTELGKILFFGKLISPIAEIQSLKNQQAIVKKIINNFELYNELDGLLQNLMIPENAVFSFWDDHDIFKNILDKDSLKLPFQDNFIAIKNLAENLNADVVINEVLDKLYYVSTAFKTTVMSVGAVTLPFYGMTLILNKDKTTFSKYLEDINEFLNIKGTLSLVSLTGVFYFIMNKLTGNKIIKGNESIVAGINNAFVIPNIHRNIKASIIFNKCLQEKLIYVAAYFSNLEKICKLIAQDELLKNTFPRLYDLSQKKICKNLSTILSLLSTNTFKGEPSFFSLTGRVLAAYKLLYAYKEEMVPLMVAIGELDMYMSIARLYKEYEESYHSFCFAEFESHATPFISVKDFWNPILDNNIIVNDLELGINGQRKNCIITGPNAGGKSTTLKGIILSVILAQSLGIAPASSLRFTPFSSITTYLNITDDIAAGNSLFKAAIIRAREVVAKVESLQDTQFALTAVDEVFNGTAYQEGQAAAYSLLKLIGNKPNSLCITATHFPIISKLERETDTFVNYKVSVEMNDNQKIQYPYKLERGISNQIITFKILQEEGFSDKFLAEAQRVLEQHKC